MGVIASIDFGASSTKAAILHPETGRVETVLFDGAPDFPSAIYLAKNGKVLVGNRAISYRGRNPLRLCTELKQHVNREAEGASARRVLRLGGDELPLVDAMSAVLGHAYAAILEQSGGPPAQVVLTHPVTWGGARKALLRKAAERAGIRSVLHLVSEPEAAVRHVLAHVPGELPVPVALLDIGASTSDLVVLTRSADGRLVPLFQDGTQAGGDDFDAGVLDHVASRLSERGLRSFAKLREEQPYEAWTVARQTKHELSKLPESSFSVEYEDLPDVPIRRERFEEATEDVVEECTAALENAIDTLRGSNPVRSVVLSGGSSSVPAVCGEAERLARNPGARFFLVGELEKGAESAAVALGAVRTAPRYEIRMENRPVFSLPEKALLLPRTTPVEIKGGYVYRSAKQCISTYRRGKGHRSKVRVGSVTGYVWSLEYDRDNGTVFSGTDNGLVQAWTVDDGRLDDMTFVGRVMSVFGFLRDQVVVAMTARRNWVAWGQKNGDGEIYQRSDGNWVRKATFQTPAPITKMAFTHHPHYLVTWDEEALRLFAPLGGEQLCSVTFAPAKHDAAFDSERGRVYVAGGGTLTCYRAVRKLLVSEFEVRLGSSALVQVGRSPDGRAVVLAYDPDESELIAVDGVTGAVLARRGAEFEGRAAMVRPVGKGYFLVLSGRHLFRVDLVRTEA